MTLVGKVLTVAILVMSILFMAFSLMVYATHRNWRELVKNPTASALKPLGLEFQLRDQHRENEELQLEMDRLRITVQMERAARQTALAGLEARAARLQDELNKRTEALRTLQGQQDAAINTMQLAQTNLSRLTTEVGDLRTEISKVLEDRDGQFQKVVTLNDTLNQLEGSRKVLEARNDALTAEFTQLKRVADRMGFSAHTPLHNVPPKLDGEVTRVSGTKLIEVSLGSDDGLRVGHTLEVYRTGGTYLGRVVVTDTDPDHAVAKILPEFSQGPIRKGDRVATRII